MRRGVLTALWAVLCVPLGAALAADSPPAKTDNANPDEIIRQFAAKEADFSKARGNYMYRQSVKIQELDEGGNPRGKYEIVEDIIFSPDGGRAGPA